MKEELLFYSAYQDFYKMTNESDAFHVFCKKAFGVDFSQDGFSDINQINTVLNLVDIDAKSQVLDVGCGNGKMLEYIHHKTGANIYGFDFSENAIEAAIKRIGDYGNFKVAIIGEEVFQGKKFDLITSMDTIYFASDIYSFIAQIYQWLKPNGSFICGYQEGDIMKKTIDCNSTVLAEAFKQNGLEYEVLDYTLETYNMLKRKRAVIISMEEEFKRENLEMWYEVVKNQTDSVVVSYEDFHMKNARYIYVLRKK